MISDHLNKFKKQNGKKEREINRTS